MSKQLSIFDNPLKGWPDPKDGLEKLILGDAATLYTEICLICGCKLNTVGEVNHRACNDCWLRRK